MKLRHVLFTVALIWGHSAFAAYQQFYVFGDSLSDSGNAFALSGGLFPPTPLQRFTNGLTTADVIASNLGIAGFGPLASGGTNYAVGGATTAIANFNHAISSPPLPDAFATTGMTAQLAQFRGCRYAGSGVGTGPLRDLAVPTLCRLELFGYLVAGMLGEVDSAEGADVSNRDARSGDESLI